jgi:hypothetical protein
MRNLTNIFLGRWAVAFIAYSLALPLGFSAAIASPSISGSRIVMKSFKYSGFTADGRPFELTAKSAVQFRRGRKGVTLNMPQVSLGMPDGKTIHMEAITGVIDQKKWGSSHCVGMSYLPRRQVIQST